MFTVGITGNFGTGKSTVARIFRSLGAKVFDADKIAHRLIGAKGRCRSRVIKRFGRKIVRNGRIDRKKLAAEVFGDAKKLKALEKIIHPAVREVIKKEFKKIARLNPKAVVVIEVPLLFETGFDRLVDAVIVVQAKRGVQLKRLKAMGVPASEAARRLKRQLPIKKKIQLADCVVDNSGTRKETERQARAIWRKFKRIDMQR